jgi:hypothetical protein
MIATELDVPFVQSVGDDVMVVGRRLQSAVEIRLQLKCAAHTAQFEIAQEQLAHGESRADATFLQVCDWLAIQRASRRFHFRQIPDPG